MYWDIVEVRPEPEYCLFVRFKDGVAGRLCLRLDELTGALARLCDPEFFRQVFIDSGAVAWPGEIDLAPDAMYVQIAHTRQPESAVTANPPYSPRRAGIAAEVWDALSHGQMRGGHIRPVPANFSPSREGGVGV